MRRRSPTVSHIPTYNHAFAPLSATSHAVYAVLYCRAKKSSSLLVRSTRAPVLGILVRNVQSYTRHCACPSPFNRLDTWPLHTQWVEIPRPLIAGHPICQSSWLAATLLSFCTNEAMPLLACRRRFEAGVGCAQHCLVTEERQE